MATGGIGAFAVSCIASTVVRCAFIHVGADAGNSSIAFVTATVFAVADKRRLTPTSVTSHCVLTYTVHGVTAAVARHAFVDVGADNSIARKSLLAGTRAAADRIRTSSVSITSTVVRLAFIHVLARLAKSKARKARAAFTSMTAGGIHTGRRRHVTATVVG